MGDVVNIEYFARDKTAEPRIKDFFSNPVNYIIIIALIHNGKPPALPGGSPRFDLCDGRKKYFPPPGRGRAREGVEA